MKSPTHFRDVIRVKSSLYLSNSSLNFFNSNLTEPKNYRVWNWSSNLTRLLYESSSNWYRDFNFIEFLNEFSSLSRFKRVFKFIDFLSFFWIYQKQVFEYLSIFRVYRIFIEFSSLLGSCWVFEFWLEFHKNFVFILFSFQV